MPVHTGDHRRKITGRAGAGGYEERRGETGTATRKKTRQDGRVREKAKDQALLEKGTRAWQGLQNTETGEQGRTCAEKGEAGRTPGKRRKVRKNPTSTGKHEAGFGRLQNTETGRRGRTGTERASHGRPSTKNNNKRRRINTAMNRHTGKNDAGRTGTDQDEKEVDRYGKRRRELVTH